LIEDKKAEKMEILKNIDKKEVVNIDDLQVFETK
jgi:hypothetical protein